MYIEAKMPIADKFLLDRLTLRETLLTQQADALDMKASVLLIAVIFLAGQTAEFLANHVQGFLHREQLVAGMAEVIAGALLAWLLRVQMYSNEAAEDYPKWRDDIVKEGETPASDIEAKMISEIVCDMATQCGDAYRINGGKVKVLKWATRTTFVAFALNLVALATLSGIRVCLFR